MPKMTLTMKEVARLQAAAEPVQIYDQRVRGLVLRVREGGRVSWSVVYTSREGKRQRATLRGPDAADLAAARAAAIRILAAASEGKSHRPDKRAGLTVSALLDAYFASPKFTELRAQRTPRYALNKHFRTPFGDRPAASITRAEIAKLIDGVAQGTDERRPAVSAARHLLGDIGALYSWAVDRGLLDASPVVKMKKPGSPEVRERVLTIEEVKTLWARLDAAPFAATTRNIVKLLILSGARVGEIAGLRHAEINLDSARIELPGSRTKNGDPFAIPLVPHALAILQAAMKAAPHTDYVFPSPRDWNKPIESNAVAKAINRAQNYFAIPQWTAHDFRRAIATNLSDNGIEPHIIEVLLNHRTGGVTRRHYNKAKYEEPHRKALETWAKLLQLGKVAK